MNTKKDTLPETVETEAIAVVEPRTMSQAQDAPLLPDAPPSPLALMSQAIQAGHKMTDMQALVDLAKQWREMEREEQERQARAAFTRAMAAFKAECPPVLDKDGEVKFKGTNYRHATLGGILQVITPHLSRAGLSVSWETDQDQGFVTVTCVVTHVDGHSERRPLTGPHDNSGNKNKIQQMGSTITYLQRYTLTAALGLSTGEVDEDGSGPEPKSDDRPNQRRGNGQQQQRPQHREEDFPPKGAQPPQEAAQPQEHLADWVPGYLKRLRVLGALREDLEGGAGRGLGKPATEWGDAEKPLIEAIGAALKAVDPGKRPVLVRDLFELQACATEG